MPQLDCRTRWKDLEGEPCACVSDGIRLLPRTDHHVRLPLPGLLLGGASVPLKGSCPKACRLYDTRSKLPNILKRGQGGFFFIII